MTDYTACETKLLIPGSSTYYAWRFTASPWQNAWLVLGALQETLWDIVLHYRELSVAQAKLLWWSEEFARMLAGQATHPIMQTLTHVLPEPNRVQGLFTEWIEGIMAVMLCEHLCTDADFALMAKRSIAMPAFILCRYYQLQDEQTLKVISQQSELLLLDYYWRYHQRLLAYGQVWIPLQRLTNQKLSMEDLTKPESSSQLKTLLITWQATLEHAYKQHWHALTQEPQSILKYPHALTRIACRRYKNALKSRHFAWCTPLRELTPLHKLWLSWY